MDFFGIGTGEVLLILVIALIVMGPGRVVEVGRTLGKVTRYLKKATFDLTSEVTRELESKEENHPPQPGEQSSDETKGSVTARNKTAA